MQHIFQLAQEMVQAKAVFGTVPSIVPPFSFNYVGNSDRSSYRLALGQGSPVIFGYKPQTLKPTSGAGL